AGLTLATPGTGYVLTASAGALGGTAPRPLSVLAGGNGVSSRPLVSPWGNTVAYVSAASNLVAGQAATGFTNVLLYVLASAANVLASGQDGSASVTGNADSDGPVLSRHSAPGFSSAASNLVARAGATSVAYLNTLVRLELSPNTIADGSAAGSLVGTLTLSGS